MKGFYIREYLYENKYIFEELLLYCLGQVIRKFLEFKLDNMSITKELTKKLTKKENEIKKSSSFQSWQKLFKFLDENAQNQNSGYTIPLIDVMEKKLRGSVKGEVKQQSNFE